MCKTFIVLIFASLFNSVLSQAQSHQAVLISPEQAQLNQGITYGLTAPGWSDGWIQDVKIILQSPNGTAIGEIGHSSPDVGCMTLNTSSVVDTSVSEPGRYAVSYLMPP